MSDSRRRWLDRRVQDLIQVETLLEQALGGAREHPPEHTTASALSDLARVPIDHRAGLLAYLGPRLPPQDSTELPAIGVLLASHHDAAEDGGWVTTLAHVYASCAYAAFSYAALFESALRLYDETLRILAPRYQEDYERLMYQLADSCALTVSAELSRQGLECQCVCPMCSLGVCGCVDVGRSAATRSLRATDFEPHGERGFLIQTPRTGSQLAEAGVEAGHRLVAIDGEPVSSVPEIQAAIRAHPIGATMRLLLVGAGVQRLIEATHVHDYPSQGPTS